VHHGRPIDEDENKSMRLEVHVVVTSSRMIALIDALGYNINPLLGKLKSHEKP